MVNRLVYRPEFGILDSPVHPRELTLLPGVPAAVAALNQAGLAVLIVTNQPGIAKGMLTRVELDELHRVITEQLAAGGGRLDGIYVCPHHPDGVVPPLAIACGCRKPAPGLLLRAAAELDLDLGGSYMIGDGDVDVLAGAAAGVTTFLVANLKPCLVELLDARGAWPDQIVPDLPAATASILVSAPGARIAAADPCGRTHHSIMSPDAHVATYLYEARMTLEGIDRGAVRDMLDELIAMKRRGGRLFVVRHGKVGQHAAHGVTDFRQLTVVEGILPSDIANRGADGGSGMRSSLSGWFESSGLSSDDLLLAVCVDGQELEQQPGPNMLQAMRYVKQRGGRVCALLGGHAIADRELVDVSVVLPVVGLTATCRHAAEAQSILLGLLASHPEIGGVR